MLCLALCLSPSTDDPDGDVDCQCNESCQDFGDCCNDYSQLCLDEASCQDQCGICEKRLPKELPNR